MLEIDIVVLVEIVEANHPPALLQERAGEMEPDEAGSTGHEYWNFMKRFLWSFWSAAGTVSNDAKAKRTGDYGPRLIVQTRSHDNLARNGCLPPIDDVEA